MRVCLLGLLLIALLAAPVAESFAPHVAGHALPRNKSSEGRIPMTKLMAKRSKGGLEKGAVEKKGAAQEEAFNVDKLKAEATAPWRNVRLFIYGSFALSSFIGGLTAAAQLAGTLGGAPNALPLKDALTNVGIDFGVLIACGVALKLDTDAQKAGVAAEMEKRQARKKMKEAKVDDGTNAIRVRRMQELMVKLDLYGDESETRDAALGELMSGAKQDVVLLAGSSAMLQDALLRAKIDQGLFEGANTLVIPINMGSGSDKGFGAKPAYMQQKFVAAPVDEEAWRGLIREELADAERQGAENAAKEGIVIVVNKKGEVVRRGLGQPSWKMIKEDLS